MIEKTMKLEDMKFLHGEMVSISGEGEYVQDVNAISLYIENQQRTWNLANDVLGKYHSFGEEYINGDLMVNYQNFLLQAKDVIFKGSILSKRNYEVLLNLTTSLVYNVQSLKMGQLVQGNYWEGITEEDYVRRLGEGSGQRGNRQEQENE